MLSPAIKSTHQGMRVDLIAPRTSMINLRDLAWHLSHTSADPAAHFDYRLAQRAVMFAEAMLKNEGPLAALYALLVNAHQAYLPALDTAFLLALDPKARQSVTDLIARVQGAVHAAFDLDWPVPADIQKALGQVYLRMRLTELRCIRAHAEEEIAALEGQGVKPLPRSIVHWKWDQAHDRFLDAWRIYAAAAHLPATKAWGGSL